MLKKYKIAHRIAVYLLVVISIIVSLQCEDIFEEDLSELSVSLSGPPNGLISSNRYFTFTWSSVKGATDYNLQVAYPSFTMLEEIVIDTTFDGNSFSAELIPGDYEWRVRGQNNASNTPWTVFSLVVDSVPSIENDYIALGFPPDSFVTNQQDFTFTWYTEANVEEYVFRILLPDSSLFVNPQYLEIDSIQFPDRSINLPVIPEGEFLWQVMGVNYSSESKFYTRSFFIDRTLPKQPVLLSPSKDEQFVDTTVSLSWTDVSDAGTKVEYELWMAEDSTFGSSSIIYLLDSINYTLSKQNKTIYWKVRALDRANNISPFSPTSRFTMYSSKNYNPPQVSKIDAPESITEDTGPHEIIISGINDGDEYEDQEIYITATSLTKELVSEITVEYNQGDTSAVLSFTPLPNANGTVTFQIEITDSGDTPILEDKSTTKEINIRVNPVNDIPTYTLGKNELEIPENAIEQEILLYGINDGEPEIVQNLSFSIKSSDENVIKSTQFRYNQGDTSGYFLFKPEKDAFGDVELTITLSDDGGTTFGGENITQQKINVSVVPGMRPPTIDQITEKIIVFEDESNQSIQLTGISDGDTNQNQQLLFEVTSSDTILIPHPEIVYTQGAETATLNFKPTEGKNGIVTIKVEVNEEDSDETTKGLSTSMSFDILVKSVNDAPTLDPVTYTGVVKENDTWHELELTGITDGDPEQEQLLTASAISLQPDLMSEVIVIYSQGDSTGILRFKPVPGKYGDATLQVIIKDNGGSLNNGIDQVVQELFITVLPEFHPPTIDSITEPIRIVEDAGGKSLQLTGITDGDDFDIQTISISAQSLNPSLVPHPSVSYSQGAQTAVLSYSVLPNMNGTASITVLLEDNGDVSSPENKRSQMSFNIEVLPVNDKPLMDLVNAPLPIMENSDWQTIELTGIEDGDPEIEQTIEIIATSSNTDILPDPTIVYNALNGTADLNYKPVSGANGQVSVTIKVIDDGGSSNGGINSTEQTIFITILGDKKPPTINQVADQGPILEDASSQSVSLFGISDGDPGEAQNIAVSAISTNTSLIPQPQVSYQNGSSSGTLVYSPLANANGSTTITVTVRDDGDTPNEKNKETTMSFNVSILPVNDEPEVDPVPSSLVITKNASTQTISLSGLNDGDPELVQSLQVFASSSDTALIADPVVNYSHGTTASVSFIPQQDKTGSVILSITIKDNGGTVNNGIDEHIINVAVKIQ